MKMRDLILIVDRSENNTTEPDIDDFSSALNLDCHFGWDEKFCKRVVGYWLIKWYCSDTWVGTRVYYMDDQPVAYSNQSARKSDEFIYFVSLEAANKVKGFILELIGEEEFTPVIGNMDEEIHELDYSVSYNSQLLVDYGLYEGQRVKVVKRSYRYDDPDLRMTEVMVMHEPDGNPFKINVSDLKIDMHLSSEYLENERLKALEAVGE